MQAVVNTTVGFDADSNTPRAGRFLRLYNIIVLCAVESEDQDSTSCCGVFQELVTKGRSHLYGTAQIRRGQHNLDGPPRARRDLRPTGLRPTDPRPTDLSGLFAVSPWRFPRNVARSTFHGCNVQASNMKSSLSRMRDDIRTHELEKATFRDSGGGGDWSPRERYRCF